MLTKEELVNKYIKYDPSITEEVFNKIIKKLNDLEISKLPETFSFEEFQTTHNIFNLNYNGTGYYIGSCVGLDDKEIKVSDIIGDEPKFVLGKWYKLGNSFRKVSKTSSDSDYNIEYSEAIIYSTHLFRNSTFNTVGCWIPATLEEIQQYLPDGHPDKFQKRTKKVEDLVYRDVVHCNSQEERDLLYKYDNSIYGWKSKYPYILCGGSGGYSNNPYDEPEYINYEFSDIIFPETKEVKPIEKWSVGSYVVFCKENLQNNGLPLGDIQRIRSSEYKDTYWHISYESACTYNDTFKEEIKWFPTLAEAETYSKSLLELEEEFDPEEITEEVCKYCEKYIIGGCRNTYHYQCEGSHCEQALEGYNKSKEPKPLTINDLVEGEIYTDTDCIFIAPNNRTKGLRITTESIATNNCFSFSNTKLRLATPEEKQWLNVCIAEGKFIEKETALRDYDMYGKALKSEVIPEYVECIKSVYTVKPGHIRKTCYNAKSTFPHRFYIDLSETETDGYETLTAFYTHFKPSTKAAYDAQFKEEMKEEFKVGDWVVVQESILKKYDQLKYLNIPVQVIENTASTPVGAYNVAIPNNKDGGLNVNVEYLTQATQSEIDVINPPKSVDKPFEFNKWYKFKGYPKYLVFIHKDGRYGFNIKGDWFFNRDARDIEYFIKEYDWTPATDSEVEVRLLSYAKEKYPVGSIAKSASSSSNINCNGKYKIFWAKANMVETSIEAEGESGLLLFKGVWADIISIPKVKSFDRNWYVEVSSEEEADKVFDYLKSIGEKTNRKYYAFTDVWCNIAFKDNQWSFWANDELPIKKQLSDILPGYINPIERCAAQQVYWEEYPTNYREYNDTISDIAIKFLESKPETKVQLIDVPRI